MCTSMAFVSGDFYFGRNMDLEGSFGEKVVITPRNFPLPLRHGKTLSTHYAMIGMANVVSGYPLYAEGANEKGLCITGLSFSGNAFYPDEAEPSRLPIATFELIPWLLGTCATTAEAKERLMEVQIVSTAFREDIQPAELHWHIADRERSLSFISWTEFPWSGGRSWAIGAIPARLHTPAASMRPKAYFITKPMRTTRSRRWICSAVRWTGRIWSHSS